MEGGPTPGRSGSFALLACYGLWGLLPLYFQAVEFASPREILAHRIVWGGLCGVIALACVGRGSLLSLLSAPIREKLRLALSGHVMLANWGLYLWLVLNNRVIEASIAYFLAPLLGTAIAQLIYRETLSASQAIAALFAAIGAALQVMATGRLPVAALAICCTWTLYAVVRRQSTTPPFDGYVIESGFLIPAAALLIWIGQPTALSFATNLKAAALLALAGPVTAVPLVLFAYGAQHSPFSSVAMLQFVTPSVQFALALCLGETVSALSLAGFVFIWLGVIIFALHDGRTLRKRAA